MKYHERDGRLDIPRMTQTKTIFPDHLSGRRSFGGYHHQVNPRKTELYSLAELIRDGDMEGLERNYGSLKEIIKEYDITSLELAEAVGVEKKLLPAMLKYSPNQMGEIWPKEDFDYKGRA